MDCDFVGVGDDKDAIIINSEYARHTASLLGKGLSSLYSLIIHLMLESFLKYHLQEVI